MNEAERQVLLQHFSEEAEEHAAAIGKGLLALEAAPGDLAPISDILRRVHSLKGAAKVVGASAVEGLAHALETILGEVQAQRLVPSPAVADVLLESVDAMRAEVARLLEGRLPEGSEDVVSRLLSLASSALGVDELLERRLPGLDPEIRQVLTEFQKSQLLFAGDAGKTCWEAELESSEEDFASRVDACHRGLKDAGEVVSLSGLSPAADGRLRFKFLLATRLPEQDIREAVRKLFLTLKDPARTSVRPAAESAALTPEQVKAEAAFAAEMATLFEHYVNEVAETLDELSSLILSMEQRPDDQALIDKVFRSAHNLKGSGTTYGLPAVSKLAHRMETLLDLLRKRKIMAVPRVTNALLRGVDTLKEIFLEAKAGTLREERPMPVLEELESALAGGFPSAAPAALAAPAPVSAAVGPRESIRVRLGKLDRLVNLAGEMTIGRNTRDAAVREVESLAFEAKSSLRQWSRFRDDLQLKANDLEVFRENGLLEKYESLGRRLSGLSGALEALWNRFSSTTLHAEIVTEALHQEVMSIRMVPVSTLFDGAPRLIRDLTSDKSKEARLQVSGEDTELDKRILEMMADPLMHILRNAVDHGLEGHEERLKAGKPRAGTISLSAEHRGSHIVIRVQDDGRGMDPRKLAAKAVEQRLVTAAEAEKLTADQTYAFIFHPGFSTKEKVTAISGRGVGMDIVRSNIENLKGRIEMESPLGRGTTFTIHLPLSISLIQAILVESAGQRFCLQTNAISEILRVEEEDVQTEDGKACIRYRDGTIPVVRLSDLLGLKDARPPEKRFPLVVVKGIGGTIGFAVERALKEQTVVLKEIGWLFRRVPHVAGGTILDDGRVSVILDAASLIAAAIRAGGTWSAAERPVEEVPGRKTLLVVDDSMTTRELLRGLLEPAGYAVVLARNGREAWGLLSQKRFDLVVSDVSMPEMDGCELTVKIKADPDLSRLPVVLVTSLAKDEERRRGLEAGADAYIVKGAFDQTGLLERVKELIR